MKTLQTQLKEAYEALANLKIIRQRKDLTRAEKRHHTISIQCRENEIKRLLVSLSESKK